MRRFARRAFSSSFDGVVGGVCPLVPPFLAAPPPRAPLPIARGEAASYDSNDRQQPSFERRALAPERRAPPCEARPGPAGAEVLESARRRAAAEARRQPPPARPTPRPPPLRGTRTPCGAPPAGLRTGVPVDQQCLLRRAAVEKRKAERRRGRVRVGRSRAFMRFCRAKRVCTSYLSAMHFDEDVVLLCFFSLSTVVESQGETSTLIK